MVYIGVIYVVILLLMKVVHIYGFFFSQKKLAMSCLVVRLFVVMFVMVVTLDVILVVIIVLT